MSKNSIFKRAQTEALIFLIMFFFFHFWTYTSLLFEVETGWSKIYFPTVIGIVFVHWLGPRILIPMYVNAIFSAGLWGLTEPFLYPLYAIPEVTTVFFSWLVFSRIFRGKCWLPDNKHLVSYIMFGIIIPLSIMITIHEILFYYIPSTHRDFNLVKMLNTLLAEFVTIVSMTIPLLYFLSLPVSRLKFSVIHNERGISAAWEPLKETGDLIFGITLILVMVLLNFFLDFVDYWFVYGFLALYISVKRGFSYSIIANFVIFINAYVVYYFFYEYPSSSPSDLVGENIIYLGLGMFFVATYIIGRVISDNQLATFKLGTQNMKLIKLNQELDRFVYSVSHDLSAPLKSIKGLVHTANLEKDKDMIYKYLYHIEKSALKLDDFIKEVLDFSRATRSELKINKIDLSDIIESCLSTYAYDGGNDGVSIFYDLQRKHIHSDELRLKIILNNLISNAYKYKKLNSKDAFLKIGSYAEGDKLILTFTDNGQGMEEEVQKKAFDIFYRGNINSAGSGLGLYIVKESILRLSGNIKLQSTPGVGTTFIVELPNLASTEDK